MSDENKAEQKTKFSFRRNEVPIEIENEDGSIGKYIIREMTGAQRDVYLKAAMSKARFDGTGKVAQVMDPTGLQPLLISLCMIDVTTEKYVDTKFVNNIRTTTQNELFELCSKINGLDGEAEEASKND